MHTDSRLTRPVRGKIICHAEREWASHSQAANYGAILEVFGEQY
jgi:hypothetical protein